MHRTILKFPRCSITDWIFGSAFPKRGNKIGMRTVESFQTVAGSKDSVTFGYGRESVNNYVGLQIVNALQLGHRNQASSLLSELDAVSEAASVENIRPILEYCARSPDPLFAMETWRIVQEKKISLRPSYYMRIVRALCNGGHVEEAIHLVKYLTENHNVRYTLPLYNCLLSACAKLKDADHCLDLMDSHLLGKNETTYPALLKLAVWRNNLSAVHEILREQCKYYNPNIISLRKFIWSFTRLKDLDSAYGVLQYMVAVALKEGTSLCRTMFGRIYCPRLDIPIPSNNVKIVMSSDPIRDAGVMSHMNLDHEETMTNLTKVLQCSPFNSDNSKLEDNNKRLIKKLLRWSFNDVIHACAQCQNAELAEKLVMQMQSLGLEPSSHTFDGLVKATIPGRGIGDTLNLIKVMEEKGVKPYDSTLSILTVSCSRALDLDLAEALLSQITSAFPQPFNAFLAACQVMDQPERAVKMVAKMRNLKIRPDVRTYELLFSLFGNVNAPYEEGDLFSQADVMRRINLIEKDMLENGVQHNHRSLKSMLKALGSEGMVQEMLQYFHRAERQLSSNIFLEEGICNIVLHSLIEAKENHKAIAIFKSMKLCGIQPDAATYNIMIDCCSNIKCFKSACALVSLMVKDGFPPQTPTYTALIKILLEYDAFDEALDLLNQALSEGSEPDVLLFNTILHKSSLQGRIDVIEVALGVMHREKIKPDPSTCSYVFDAYVDREFFGSAVEALQILSIRMILADDDTVEDKKREYEDLILSEEAEAEMQIMMMFGHSVNVAAALLNLRWCSLMGSSISWMPDQSPWAKRLSSASAAQIVTAT